MKTLIAKQTETSFFIPATDFLAVWNAVSTEETRYYLNGIFVEKTEIGIRMTATDGHVLMSANADADAFVGKGCFTQADQRNEGFILRADTSEKAFKAKAGDLWIYGDVETGILQFVDKADADAETGAMPRLGVCEFTRIDGTFPDYRRVMPAEQDPTAVACFDPDLLMRFKKAQDVYAKAEGRRNGSAIRLNPGDGSSPMRVDLHRAPHFTGVLMPMRWQEQLREAA